MASSRLLMVEGSDDEHVVYALCGAHNIPRPFEVAKKWGVEQLLGSIPVELKASDRERLAVIVDADDDLAARWSQLAARLRQAGCAAVPEEPGSEGTIVRVSDNLLFGVWLMPDNRLAGMLEDFVAFLVPNGDPLLPRVDGFLAGITGELRRFPDAHECKARIHSWLAIQKGPGKPMGQAITARYLDPDCGQVRPFLNWLRAALVD
jgi:hypothetical protein